MNAACNDPQSCETMDSRYDPQIVGSNCEKKGPPPIEQLAGQLEQAVQNLEQSLGKLDSQLANVKTSRPPATEEEKMPMCGQSPLANRLSCVVNNLSSLNRFARQLADDLEV